MYTLSLLTILSAFLPTTLASKAGEFECIDDTTFKHFSSATDFVTESCPPGFCATRNPPFKNPCIGKANALRIDGGEAGLPVTITTNASPVSTEIKDSPAVTGSPKSAADLSATASAKAGEFQCIDDTKFKHFSSATAFITESCPPGFCATRNPPFKNPCIGKANALRIDGGEAAAV